MPPNTPYCSTCRKAGKSFGEYTNHWTRSEPGPNGFITCPLILNSVCSYCKQKGHWNKYCTALNNQKISPLVHNILNTNPTPTPTWASRIKSNIKTNIVVRTDDNDRYTPTRPISPDYSPPTSRPPSPDYPPPPDLYYLCS